MARRGNQRRNYAQVASREDEGDDDQQQQTRNTSTDETSSGRSRALRNAESSSLLTASSNGDDGNDQDDNADDLEKGLPGGGASNDDDDDDGDDDIITVVILDITQKKFNVDVPATATVETLKHAGAKIHKVSADRQRLIFRGQMLQDDDETLEHLGIASKTIVHLFPKPRVVIQSAPEEEHQNDGNTDANDSDGDDDDEGARVPTIVLNEREAESRSQILVLGSADYIEAQNNVKLFSFMLLIISSIELMNLLAVAMGVPQEDEDEHGMASTNDPYDITIDDDIFPSTSPGDDAGAAANMTLASNPSMGGSGQGPAWTAANYVDLVISLAGVYVGIMGLQATSLNTLSLARRYMIGTVLTGIGWMAFNFVMTYDLDKAAEKEREENHSDDALLFDDGDIRWQAISVMVLPGMVWFLCCLRAWQFQHLISEAEVEAEERIRSEFATVVTRAEGNGDDDNHAEGQAADANHDEELTLQNESARIS